MAWFRRRMTADTKNFVNYFRVTPDNCLLFGGRARFAATNPKSGIKSGAILQRRKAEARHVTPRHVTKRSLRI